MFVKGLATRLPSKKLFRQYNPQGTQDLDEWRRVFIECGDPTEYAAAHKLCGSWKEWERIKGDWKYFANVILPEWHEELEISLRSQAIKRLVSAAKSDDRDASAAAKWIAEGRYKPKGVGRPNKDKIAAEERIRSRVKDEIEDEVSRVLDANTESSNPLPN